MDTREKQREKDLREVGGAGRVSVRLHYQPPFEFETLLTYFRLRALPGVEEVTSERYRRTVELLGLQGIVEVEPVIGENAVFVHLYLNEADGVEQVVQRCGQLFDLDANPTSMARALADDSLLAPMVAARPGLRIPGAFSGFELAVRAILGQQVSVAAARTLAGRIVTAYGEPLAQPQGALRHYFPAPEKLVNADMQSLGITRSRITALQALARAVEDGLVLDRSADKERVVAHLQTLPGIGPWTASYIAMRALGDSDAFPVVDLGLRRAFEKQGLAASPRHIAARAEVWRPWRAYATHYLWASLSASSK